jgi:hypothetical protein
LQDAHRDRPVNLRDWLVVVQREHLAAFFETLVAGADEYNKAKVGRTALLDAVYKDVKPEAARIGKTVDVYFPDVGPLQAINNGQLTATSVNPNYIPLVFQTRAGAALQFQDFEQWQTAVDLAQKFFDPPLQAGA